MTPAIQARKLSPAFPGAGILGSAGFREPGSPAAGILAREQGINTGIRKRATNLQLLEVASVTQGIPLKKILETA